MSEDYETKRADLHASQKDRDGERPAVEDPLVELARIVHKNKQSGAHVSSGRVGSTDYFAGLDDVTVDQATSPEPSSRRVEPTFSSIRPVSEGSAPERPATDRSVPEDTLSRGTYGESGPDEGEPSRPAANSQVNSPQVNSPTAGGYTAGGGATVSSLWPRQTDSRSYTGQSQSFNRPHEPEIEAPAEPAIPEEGTSLAPSLALDLEQNLTAELEDELIGALRQSVDETADETGYSDNSREVAARADDSDIFGSYPQAGHQEPGHRYETVTRPAQVSEPAVEPQAASIDTAPASSDYPAPAVEHGAWRANAGTARQEPRQDATAGLQPAQTRQRPAIDENDFLAALNSAQTEVGQDTAPDVEGDGNLAGIDALFADLDFPDPVDRRPGQASVQAPSRAERVPTPEIDDMTWPAAAESVPHADDDETPPPPEGYDLDAVARAMQESDPSLGGAGVLPPHPAAERAAIPHARERSRRGIFVAAGVLGVAVLGAGGFLMMEGNSVEVPSGPPPVISGLQDPLKVYPDETAAAADKNQTAKLIYDRVGGDSTGPERLVVPETPEPAELPPAPAEATGDADLVPGSPRQVRTLIVRPDGTIISGGEQPTPASETPASPLLTAPVPSTTAETPRVVSTTPVVTENAPADQIASTPETAPAASAQTPLAAPELSGTSAPAIVTQPDGEAPAASEPQVSEPAGPVPSVLPRKKPDAPVQIARAPEQTTAPAPATQQDGPLNLNQQANAPTTETAPASAPSSTGSISPGTYIVQVTSQRTADAASDAYSGLQRRFPAVLGSREAVIVSADLGDRGVFYRARIPTGSRDEAISLCESLKGAGGDCFVRRQP